MVTHICQLRFVSIGELTGQVVQDAPPLLTCVTREMRTAGLPVLRAIF